MARKQLFEWSAKKLILTHLGHEYTGIAIKAGSPSNEIKKLNPAGRYVVKVDQGVKKRFKQGLVILDVPLKKIPDAIETLHQKGFNQYIIEPFLPHTQSEEAYLAFERKREGVLIYVSQRGGIDIEEHGSVKTFFVSTQTVDEVTSLLSVPSAFITKLLELFDQYYFSFLEINPLVIQKDTPILLDVAAEVDDAGSFFVQHAWTTDDFAAAPGKVKTQEEIAVDQLSEQSQASFRLEVLNPNGSIFMLLSGGGASIVLADEVANQGKGAELANYGEYSGNPNAEETYFYTKQILSLLLSSPATRKVLIIGGGVANFTDIRITFQGVIKAISEVARELQKQNVKVYVRRGGPYQREGLAHMKEFLEKEHLFGMVAGPETPLTDIVAPALKEVSHA